MLTAILSDIHANLEALQAVLADIETQGADRIYNLGNTVGYGPNPLECIELAERMDLMLQGNFDFAVPHDPATAPPGQEDPLRGFGAGAERSVLWTRKLVQEAAETFHWNRWTWFLANRPVTHREGNVQFVH